MALSDDIADELTRHSVGLQRLSASVVRKIIAMLNRSDARIVERLLASDISAISRTRQEVLLREIRRIVDSAHTDAMGALRIEIEGLAQYEGEYQHEVLQRFTPAVVDFVRPSEAQILAAVNSRPFQGKLMREWLSELGAATARRVRDAIRAGYVEGLTTEQIVRQLRGTASQGYKDGVLEITRRHAQTVVRTAINHTANTARSYVYDANRDLVKAVKWVSTLDSRTSLVCMGRDNKVYPVDSGPRPPAHPNCRSTTVPVLRSWRELGIDADEFPAGTRASMNGQVPSDMDYDTFLRRQSQAFQDDVLGQRRAALFRAGANVDRFTDRAGNELTLDQLRRREREYWQAAGL